MEENVTSGHKHHHMSDHGHHHHHHHHSSNDDSTMEPHHHHDYQAYFSFSTTSTLLVQEWTTSTILGLVLGMVTGASLSIILEALKCYVYVQRLTVVYKQLSVTSRKRTSSISKRIVSSVLHALHALTGYILMLMAMSFNAWIMVAIVLGAGIGHFFIRPVFRHLVDQKLQKHFRKDRKSPIYKNKEDTEPLRINDETASCEDCSDKSVDNNACTSTVNASSQYEQEKQTFLSWDPIRQSRQFQVKGKETSV